MRHYISLLLLASILISSCSSSNDVVSRGAISKRKYRDGFHLDLRKHNHKDIAKTYTSGESSAPQVSQVEKEDISKHSTSIIPTEKEQQEVTKNNSIFHKLRQKKKASNDGHELSDVTENQTEIEPEKIRKKQSRPSSESNDRFSQDEILAIVFTSLAFLTLSIPLIGLVFSILGLVFSRKADSAKPTQLLQILKIFSIVFLVMSILYLLFYIGYFVFIFLFLGGFWI